MNKENLFALSNYIHAVVYAWHVDVVQLSKKIPNFSYKGLRNGNVNVAKTIDNVASIVHTSPDDFIHVMYGNDKPIKALVSHAREQIHDRKGLKHFLTIIAYAHGTTLAKLSVVMGNSPSYLNVLVLNGTQERMDEKLTKASRIFHLSPKVMKDAIARSKVRHRKFAGGYFGGNHGHFHEGRLKKFVKEDLAHDVNVDKMCKAIDNHDTRAIVEVLGYITILNHYPVDDYYEALKVALLGRYIPEAKKFVKKLQQNYENMKVVETAEFSDNIKGIGEGPAGSDFIKPTVNYLREFRHIFGISGKYKCMRISGFKPILVKSLDPQKAYHLASRWYHEIPLKNLSQMVNKPKFLKTYRDDVNTLKKTAESSSIRVIRVKTVARFDNRLDVVMYLDLFAKVTPGKAAWQSVVQMTPLVFKHRSAKVRRLLKKYRR